MNTGPITVFFSWQSDTPASTNTNAIRSALSDAKAALEEKDGISVVLDEATRNTPGSPNIISSICRKIDAAQVYVADITTITPQGDKGRRTPNPNVLIELGYAVAQLGWDRIILLFNGEFGSFDDIPFDIVQNRIAQYTLAPDVSNPASKKQLGRLLEDALRLIIKHDPKTPIQLLGIDPERLKHQRDAASLEQLFSNLHISTLQEHIRSLPRLVHSEILFYYWPTFEAYVTSKAFHIYDPALDEALARLYQAWASVLSHGECYDHHGSNHVFRVPKTDPNYKSIWDAIEKDAIAMDRALDDVLQRIRTSYVEIDLQKTDAQAWHRFWDWKNEVDPPEQE